MISLVSLAEITGKRPKHREKITEHNKKTMAATVKAACPEWRFAANEKNRSSVGAHFQGCACADVKRAPPCRPLAKSTGEPEIDDLINDWLRWDRNECTRNQITELANKGNIPG